MYLAAGPPLDDPKRVYEGLLGLSLHAALCQRAQLKRLLGVGSRAKEQANARDADGDRCPLHWAAARGAVACAKLLLAAGAAPDALDASGRTPAALALETRQGDVHMLLSRITRPPQAVSVT